MSQSWERIQSLFLEALDLRPEERASFLDAACADDAEVRREVESLIAHDGTDEQPIADALEDTAQSLFESENLDRTRLGAWRVLKEIGRGGMATVYLAWRDDEFQKYVAQSGKPRLLVVAGPCGSKFFPNQVGGNQRSILRDDEQNP